MTFAGKERRPIIEFAIENVNILQKRQLRQKMADSTMSERVPRRVPSAAQHVQVELTSVPDMVVKLRVAKAQNEIELSRAVIRFGD